MKPFASSTTLAVLALVFVVIYIFASPVGFWSTLFVSRFWWWLIAAVHVLFGIGIARDAMRRNENEELLFVEPITWAITVLVFGLAAIALYWLMHHSTLSRR